MSAVLHVLSDRTRHRLPLLETLSEAARGGVDVIQIREKKAPAAETFAFVNQLRDVVTDLPHKPSLLVNDRVDIALAANLDGVHLAAKSLPIDTVAALRKRTQWQGQIGCSVHSLEEACLAEQMGASYVTFGHIFASESHPGMPPRGLQSLRRVVDAVSIPVIAIGGIDHTNLQPVLETGCSGIAVIGAILNADSPFEATRTLKRAIEKSDSVPKVPFIGQREVKQDA